MKAPAFWSQRIHSSLLALGFAGFIISTSAAEISPVSTNTLQLIDLPTALKLAGARSLDIQIARERLAEARANYEGTLWQFFPWISPGAGYRRHDDLTQDVAGNIVNANKESYTVGPVISAQIDLGDAIFKNLASKQFVKAADFGLESQRQDSLHTASQAYLDLLKAHAAVSVANEAIKISDRYLEQIQRAAEAGIAFKGDVLRVQVQVERNQIVLQQTQEQMRIASAKLVQALHLASGLELVPDERELVQLTLIPTNAPLASLVEQGLSMRPELKQNQAVLEAARNARKGAVYGPLIPTLGAQAFAGGFGGGRDGAGQSFGRSEDYQVALSWRIGPGGLFDRSRVKATDARMRIADATNQKLQDTITRQVIENYTRSESLANQLATARRAVKAAEESLRLSEERKEFAVANVLETILAEQELTRSRLDVSNAIAEYNKAQYSLMNAMGGMLEPPEKQSRNVSPVEP